MSGVVSRFTKSDVKFVDRDWMKLHPLLRAALREVELTCQSELLPFHMFEGYRSPQRQRHLYLQGRVSSRPGRILTQAAAWESYHQFGLAADFALVVGTEWSFDTSPANSLPWTRLREIGEMYSLEGGDPGHLQCAGFELADLLRGCYPGGGDDSWWENLRRALESYPPRSVSRSERVASPVR